VVFEAAAVALPLKGKGVYERLFKSELGNFSKSGGGDCRWPDPGKHYVVFSPRKYSISPSGRRAKDDLATSF
jgi:hypothetical protein